MTDPINVGLTEYAKQMRCSVDDISFDQYAALVKALRATGVAVANEFADGIRKRFQEARST